MTNPQRDEAVLESLEQALATLGHQVLTPHVVRGRQADVLESDQELARRDLHLLSQAEALVAEVSAPSHGVGIEVYAACLRRIPVLLVAREGALVSRLLMGLPGVHMVRYGEARELPALLAKFFSQL